MLAIVPLGDSMMKGDEADEGDRSCPGDTSYRSPRGTLQDLLSAGGYQFDFKGPSFLTPAQGGRDPDHAAYGGAMITPFAPGTAGSQDCAAQGDDATADGQSRGNLSTRLPGILAAAPSADLFVISLGWNSVNCAGSAEVAADQMTDFIGRLRSAAPDAQIVLTTLTPRQGETEAQTIARTSAYGSLNDRIRALGTSDPAIHVADIARLPLSADQYRDDIHWCQPAADAVARRVYEVISTQVRFERN